MTRQAGSKGILCAGRLYCDLVFTQVPQMPVVGTEVFSGGLSLHAGGGAFITSAAFSALGWNAALLTTLPVAPFDTVVSKDLSDFHLDTTYCARSNAMASPQITVAISGKEDRAFLSHKSGAALPEVDFSDGNFLHLHVGELRSLIEHPNLVEKARKCGLSISLDCGWDGELLDQGSQVADLISQVDVFLPNATEYDLLQKSGLPAAAAKLTVVKCGQDGARALNADHWVSARAQPANVVDTTGAGDAFNGGFLSSWLSGASLEDCLSNGNRCGKYAVEEAGGAAGLRSLKTAQTRQTPHDRAAEFS